MGEAVRAVTKTAIKKQPDEAEASVPQMFEAFHGRGRESERGTEIKTNTENYTIFTESQT